MKIEITQGCICDSFYIDNDPVRDMTLEELQDILTTIINKSTNRNDLESLLYYYVENNGEYEDLGRCDECGDYISRYTLEI